MRTWCNKARNFASEIALDTGHLCLAVL